jgi:FKBP-type peptidyl-prolyl cis-trans isomerase FkpA
MAARRSRRSGEEQLMQSRSISVRAALLRVVIAGGAIACGCSGASSGASSSPTPTPLASDVERTTFAPSLGVHIESMSRRPSGLYVQDLESGTGAVVTRGRTAVVRYTGWLANGDEFDSGEVSVSVGSHQTIPAWEEALLGMRVGGKRRIVTPPNLAYGASGAGKIPPNAVLVFDMEVTDVE